MAISLMMVRMLLLSLFLGGAWSMMESPREWLDRGFDITDGVLKEFPDYKVELKTSCKDVSLNKAPYNYNGTVMSGYLSVGKGDSALAFIFYGKENADKNQIPTIPTILWLNGGPGSTSQLGNLMELGPFRLKENRTRAFEIVRNQYAWTNSYNILFVDQPVGTGLSYADPAFPKAYVTNMTEMANDFYRALSELYEK